MIDIREAILNGTDGAFVMHGFDLSHAALTKILPTQPKCCQGCAFRVGSQERSDPYRWIQLTEDFDEGKAFLCHEGIPGHGCQKPGAELSLCAGRAALDGKPMWKLGLIDHKRRCWACRRDGYHARCTGFRKDGRRRLVPCECPCRKGVK